MGKQNENIMSKNVGGDMGRQKRLSSKFKAHVGKLELAIVQKGYLHHLQIAH